MQQPNAVLMKNDRLLVLETYRGICALLVAALHALGRSQTSLVAEAYLAVDLFFMLSGFILAFKYENDLLAGKLPRKKFMIMRFIRLWPLVAFGISFGLLSTYLTGTKSNQELLTGAVTGYLMLPDFFHISKNTIFPLNFPLWSIFFELMASVAFCRFVYRMDSKSILTVALVSFIILAFASNSTKTAISYGYDWNSFWFGFPRLALSFLIGVFIFRHIERIKIIRVWLDIRYFDIILSVVLFTACALVSDSKNGNPNYELFSIVVTFPALIVLGVMTRATSCLQKIYLALGFISFPVYVLHNPMLELVRHFSPDFFVMSSRLDVLNLVLAFVVLVVLAFVVGRFVDLPIREFLRKRLLKPDLTVS
jgi:peptidoglycan/LPS O-acetylase OafA/YrhL